LEYPKDGSGGKRTGPDNPGGATKIEKAKDIRQGGGRRKLTNHISNAHVSEKETTMEWTSKAN